MARVAVVTGGTRGIGEAISKALKEAGYSVAANYGGNDEAAQKFKAASDIPVYKWDVASYESCAAGLKQVESDLGPVEVLVNNAGIGSSADPRPVADFDDDFWELTLRVNLTAPYLLCKAVLPAMRARRKGRIINVASVNSRVGAVHGAAYAASKHGLLGLTRSLALEVAKEGITVNAICPGPVHTVMNDRRVAYDARRHGVSFADQEASLTPVGGRLEPEEVAPLAVYLAGDEARMVTGQAYNICGGIVMS
jgi:3-hydroxybutyrate dehydrogenase